MPADRVGERPPIDLTAALDDVRGLNQLCFALRDGFRRLHPEIPELQFERTYREAVEGVLARHGVDFRHLLD